VQAFLGLYFHWANASTRRSERRVRWMARITRMFVAPRVVRFHDSSLRALPMDNEIDNDLLPAAFTELWIDLDRAHEVGAALSAFYAEDAGWARSGSFACELYAAKRSRFWLSPGYGRDSIRVDLMHIEQGAIRPESEYFPQFWSLLAPFDARFHWGKLMPPPGRLAGREYFRRVYPRWEDFVELRSRLDPQRLFVNEYWRAYLD
jgi:D-arabinono-1,4-lactone oxidase